MMAQKHPTLWHVREQHGITRELIAAFREKAAAAGLSPSAALARVLRRYLARGFDDGQPETTAATPDDEAEAE